MNDENARPSKKNMQLRHAGTNIVPWKAAAAMASTKKTRALNMAAEKFLRHLRTLKASDA